MRDGLLYDGNRELAEEVLQRLAEGETLLSICRDIAANDPKFPTLQPHHIREWAREYESFGKEYALALADGADALIDQMQDIAEHPTITEIITEKWSGGRKPKLIERQVRLVDALDRDKLKILVRQYRARMMSPHVQNVERRSVDVNGNGEGGAITVEIKGGLPTRVQNVSDRIPIAAPENPPA